MSAAVLSLIEIIFVAVSSTETLVPETAYWSDGGELPTLLTASVTVKVWSQEMRPAAISSASAPKTNNLNCDAVGRGVNEATSWTGRHVPFGETRAATRPTFGPSWERP